MKKKGALISDYLGKIAIGVAILVLIMLAIAIMTGKGQGALDYIKNLFRFGR